VIILILNFKILEFSILDLFTGIFMFLDIIYVILLWKCNNFIINLRDFSKMRHYIVSAFSSF